MRRQSTAGTRTGQGVFDHPSYAGHEQVIFCHDRATGLRAIIAIHDTTFGPGAGGTRMWPYASEAEALKDVLRLSQGMTYKSVMARLPLGGAKAVIIGDARKDKSPALMQAYGRHIDRLGGNFITGEDVGMTVADMDAIATVTKHVRGTSAGVVADPSPHTALGVLAGIRAAARHKLGRNSLKDLRVCVQGLGNVGMSLAGLLHKDGARLVVADIREQAVKDAQKAFSAEVVDADAAHAADVDIFAPCALGAGLNQETIPEVKAAIVAGSANNQLASEADGARLAERDILYAPDYVINAGGIIALIRDDLDAKGLNDELLAIGDTCLEIFQRAAQSGEPTSEVADRIAEERLVDARSD